MKIKAIALLLFCTVSSYCMAQDSNSSSLSVKSIDSIAGVIKNKNRLTLYTVLDSVEKVSRYYWVDKKSKELLAIQINHNLSGKKGNYNAYSYYFCKEELIKLYIRQSRNKKNKKGVFYFSNGKLIHKEGILAEDSYLKEPVELLGDYKSFINLKRNGG